MAPSGPPRPRRPCLKFTIFCIIVNQIAVFDPELHHIAARQFVLISKPAQDETNARFETLAAVKLIQDTQQQFASC